MARYIKVNPKVAEYLHLENDRNKVTDGNYLLWQADMLAFGRLSELPEILIKIGGLSLQAHEAREEQDGTVVRKLPVATDPRFIVEVEEPAQEPEAPEEPQDDAQQPGEEAEAGQEEADTGAGDAPSNDDNAEQTTNEETEA